MFWTRFIKEYLATSDIESSLVREDVALYGRNYKRTFGICEQNRMLDLRREFSSVTLFSDLMYF